jgi:hypothetical protein
MLLFYQRYAPTGQERFETPEASRAGMAVEHEWRMGGGTPQLDDDETPGLCRGSLRETKGASRRRSQEEPAMDHIGVDVHKRESQIDVLCETGEVIECGCARAANGLRRCWGHVRPPGSCSKRRRKVNGSRR